jgi:hypothetical protein
MGDVVGRGHFGYICAARVNKGACKGSTVAITVTEAGGERAGTRTPDPSARGEANPVAPVS